MTPSTKTLQKLSKPPEQIETNIELRDTEEQVRIINGTAVGRIGHRRGTGKTGKTIRSNTKQDGRKDWKDNMTQRLEGLFEQHHPE